MIILTAANADQAKNDQGDIYKNFSFVGVIQKTVLQAEKFGYVPVVYDLGSLGIGESYLVEDESFVKNGFYKSEVKNGYKSKSLFKPDIVKLCMEKYDDVVVYLDGDAQLCGAIDEIDSDDYDIGVTLRDPCELEGEWYDSHVDIVKYVNAGVIFFRPTPAAKVFIDTWMELTQSVGNDQMALNKLSCPEDYPEVGSIHDIGGVRVKYFSGKIYNYYYFENGLVPNVKIMHFKGPVRHFYPFDWKKKLYCKTVVPLKGLGRRLIDK